MVSKYLTIELLFLVPLVLAVALPVLARRKPAELRFFGAAVLISLVVLTANVIFILMRYEIGFPASFAFLLFVAAYAMNPSLIASIFSTLIGAAAVIGVVAAMANYADSHIGSVVDRHFTLLVPATGLLAGLGSVTIAQLGIKCLFRRNQPANNCKNSAGGRD